MLISLLFTLSRANIQHFLEIIAESLKKNNIRLSQYVKERASRIQSRARLGYVEAKPFFERSGVFLSLTSKHVMLQMLMRMTDENLFSIKHPHQ